MRGRTKRDRYHHGDLRSALVVAGRQLLAERGLHGFTLRECARMAGVTHAAPAHHFPTVGDLLAEIAAIGFEDLTGSMHLYAEKATAGDARGQLIGLGRGYIAFAISNRAVFQLMFRRENFTFTAERFVAAATGAFMCLVQAVELVLPKGDAEERGLMVDLAWSVVHGFATLTINGQICKGEADPAVIDGRAAAILNAWFRDINLQAAKTPSRKSRPGRRS